MKRGAKFGVVLISISLALTSVIVNAGYGGKKISVESAVLTPFGRETLTVELSERDIDYIQKKSIEVQDALTVITDVDADEAKRNDAGDQIEEFIQQLQKFGLIPVTLPVTNALTNFMSPKADFLLPVISLGKGMSWIPLYPGEAFIGFMLRPIFMQYFLLGYTASLNVNLLPPRIEYWDMVGTHTLIILGFVGVYIDFGQIGYGVPDLQFIMGESLLAGGFDWL